MHPIIQKCPLFASIEPAQLEALLGCLSATRRTFAREAFVFIADDPATAVGIVMSGSVNVIQEDFWGNRTILAHIAEGGLFGEAFSCAGTQKLPISVVAVDSAEIMLIDYRKIIVTCTSACVFHTRLITNMLRILAEKNILLTRKMEHLGKRTTREKLLSYLSARAVEEGGSVVEIPFNRQELADYLCVDRSALSRELSAMREEGLLEYSKNRFELRA